MYRTLPPCGRVLIGTPCRFNVDTTQIENDHGRSGRVDARPPRSFASLASMYTQYARGSKPTAPFTTAALQVTIHGLAGSESIARHRRGTAQAYSYLTSRTSQATSNRLSTDNEPLITELGDGAAARICIKRDPCRFGGGRI